MRKKIKRHGVTVTLYTERDIKEQLKEKLGRRNLSSGIEPMLLPLLEDRIFALEPEAASAVRKSAQKNRRTPDAEASLIILNTFKKEK